MGGLIRQHDQELLSQRIRISGQMPIRSWAVGGGFPSFTASGTRKVAGLARRFRGQHYSRSELSLPRRPSAGGVDGISRLFLCAGCCRKWWHTIMLDVY